MIFIWNPRSTEHVGKHDITRNEAEYVVRNGKPPYPDDIGNGKFCVWGATDEGRLLQVIYVLRTIDEVEFRELPRNILSLMSPDENFYCIIHARDLSENEKRQLRRRRR